MVCHGNICRSPLAEGIMNEKIKKYKLNASVDSAGTASYHTGEMPDPRSIDVARKNGIDISYQRARKFSPDDFHRFDRIYAMDTFNFNDLISIARKREDKEKLEMILNVSSPGKNRSVPDPYYGGNEGFDNVYNMLDEACELIALEIKQNQTQ